MDDWIKTKKERMMRKGKKIPFPYRVTSRPRFFGARTEQVMKAISQLEAGVKVLYVSRKWVIMSTEEWERLKNSKVDGDLVSNCCGADFDAFGYEKEEGIWQERCINCGHLCEPLYLADSVITQLQSLAPERKR